MRGIGAFALCIVLAVPTAAFADKTPCPAHVPGDSYPWDISQLMAGDKYASVFIDVDRNGRPLACRVGANNISDDYTRFQLCDAYNQDWHATPTAAGDPDRRTIKRDTIMIGSAHQLANQNARKAWFRAHPGERQSCYPE